MAERKPCETCMRLRAFLFIGLALVVLIGLKPAGIVRLAGYLPDANVIASLMMFVGAGIFAVRYARYIKEEGAEREIPRSGQAQGRR
jgi:disulfide bond formation protein DsbB